MGRRVCDAIGKFKNRRVGGRACDETANLEVVDFEQSRKAGYNHGGEEGDGRTIEHPIPTSIVERGSKVATRSQANSGKEKNDAKLVKHEVASGIHIEIERAQTSFVTQENGDEERSARDAKFGRDWETWDGNRDGSDKKSEEDADEDWEHVRNGKRLGGIAEFVLDIVENLGGTDDANGIAQLKRGMERREDFDARAVDACDVSLVSTVDADLLNGFSRYLAIGDEDVDEIHRAVDIASFANGDVA